MENRNYICGICGEHQSILVHRGTRDNKNVDVYQCTSCGTKFLSVIGDYDYENGFMNQTSQMSMEAIDARVTSCYEDDFRRFNLVGDLCQGKRVLDFGCGFGGFLKFVSCKANEVMGVELGKDERNYLKQQGIPCSKVIDDVNCQYDVITMFHVLEHLSNPVAWLDKISNYLCTGGKLIVEVPNANDALLELYQCKDFSDFTYWSAHLYLYTKRSLNMLIQKTNKLIVDREGEIQRYPLANHLMWLSKGEPGGHVKWDFLNSKVLDKAYEDKLREIDACDTLFFVLKKSRIDDMLFSDVYSIALMCCLNLTDSGGNKNAAKKHRHRR